MFWSQVDDNSILDLLIKEDVTLEEVLDHESILQECKIQNEKLIKFFCINDNFSKLINYILVTPSEDIEEKVRFKYPSLVCEVLTSDVPEINELLVNGIPTEDGSDFKLFTDCVFDSLDINVSINPLTISYIVKILLNILKHNNDKVMSIIIRRHGSLDLLLKHVENNAIAVFFSEFLMCDEECTATRIQWLSENNFVYKCAQLFSVSEYTNNAVQELLCEVIRASWKFFANKEIRDEIRSQLNGKTFLDLIFSHLSNSKSDSNLITGCLKVVRMIVDFEIGCEGTRMESVKEMILQHFSSINALLSSPPKQMYDPMPTTIGQITPFGPTRLEIVYLLESLLKLNDCDINHGIGQTKILSVLLDAVSQYRWNTMFQLGLLKIFDILFADLSTKCQYKGLLEGLVSDYEIYQWYIVTISEATELQKRRPGTIGLLWKIGNHLDSLWGSEIAEYLINKEPEQLSVWSKIVIDHLQPRNDMNVIVTPKIDNCFNDIKMVDIDEDSLTVSTDPNKISDFFLNKSANLNDIFGASSNDDDDDWIENQLNMPTIPIDDFPIPLGSYKKSKSSLDDEDSSSEDEESPAVIRQNKEGTEAKYLFSDLGASNGDLVNLYEVPDFSDDGIATLAFDDPWKTKSSEPGVQNNWANFSS